MRTVDDLARSILDNDVQLAILRWQRTKARSADDHAACFNAITRAEEKRSELMSRYQAERYGENGGRD